MPLYRVHQDRTVAQIKQAVFSKERDIQQLFEKNLEVLLGVRYVGSEFTTGDRQRGRIDTLGLDQDDYPTIIEYKRSSKENIINQGLFYLDWLVDHRGDYTLAAQKALGAEVKIDWSRPRLILVAESFTEYDQYAVNRIGANIELWTFRKYGDELLYLDPLFVSSPASTKKKPSQETEELVSEEVQDIQEISPVYTLDDHIKGKPKAVVELFELLRERIFEMSEEGEITEVANKMYVSYKHGKNFAEVRLQAGGLKIWLDIPYSDLADPQGLVRDVSKVGHYGTGTCEVKLAQTTDIDKAMDLIKQSFIQTI